MAMTIHVRSECDRCHVVVDADVTEHKEGATTVPPGWHLFAVTGKPLVWCPECIATLQQFKRANDDVEQSR